MNQSIRITEKTLRIAIVAGTILLAVTILILAIAVGATRRRETMTTPVLTTKVPLTTQAPSTETAGTPDPQPV